MGTSITEDFEEHSHPQYGRGYFCTEDVLAKLAALEADARRLEKELEECRQSR